MAQQLTLFDDHESKPMDNYLDIPGLTFYPNVLGVVEQIETLAIVDALPWQSDLKRRVQHYGYKYDYKARSINTSMFVGPLPDFAVAIGQKMLAMGLVSELPDQLIINEYLPGQGISAHIDCEPCFKNTIVTISLGSVYEMDFISVDTGEIRSTKLELGSALILRDCSRYNWRHRINARKSDHGVKRGRRVSLTFRNVILCQTE